MLLRQHTALARIEEGTATCQGLIYNPTTDRTYVVLNDQATGRKDCYELCQGDATNQPLQMGD